MRLNLGCGPVLIEGHLNLDLDQVAPDGESFRRVDVRRGLPFADRSVESINASHFLEHLTLPEARMLLAECRRVLVARGLLRVAVPDLGLLARCYIEGDMDRFAGVQPPIYGEVSSPGLKASLLLLGNMHPDSNRERYLGHQLLLDENGLAELLCGAGFAAVGRAAFDPALDAPAAENHSLVMQATAP